MSELINPINGEIVDPTNIDNLAVAWLSYAELFKQIRAFGESLKLAIYSRYQEQAGPDDKARTVRIQGEIHRIKLEMPGEQFDQKALKDIVAEFPDLAPRVVRVKDYAVMAVEWKKLQGTRGNAHLTNFKKKLLAAIKPAAGLPTINVENL